MIGLHIRNHAIINGHIPQYLHKGLFLKTLGNILKCNIFAKWFRSQNTAIKRMKSASNIYISIYILQKFVFQITLFKKI